MSLIRGAQIKMRTVAPPGKAHVIKSHHNVGCLPDKMKLRLCGTMRELFKDEVRRVGVELGRARNGSIAIRSRGPGLGVRILGEVTKAVRGSAAQKADAI